MSTHTNVGYSSLDDRYLHMEKKYYNYKVYFILHLMQSREVFDGLNETF